MRTHRLDLTRSMAKNNKAKLLEQDSLLYMPLDHRTATIYSPIVTGRQSHIGYTSREKRIILSNRTNSYINEDLKLKKEEEGKRRGELSYIYILR